MESLDIFKIIVIGCIFMSGGYYSMKYMDPNGKNNYYINKIAGVILIGWGLIMIAHAYINKDKVVKCTMNGIPIE